MKQGRFYIAFLLLLVAQVCICNYFRFSQYVMITLLPEMILLIPIRRNTIVGLFTAFAAGFAVDFLSDGVLGLNIAALLPVALARTSIIRLVFGDEVFARKEDISVPRQGIWKMSLAVLMAQALFLVVYIWLDGAGTRPLWFSAVRFGASLTAGYIFSLFVVETLAPERNRA